MRPITRPAINPLFDGAWLSDAVFPEGATGSVPLGSEPEYEGMGLPLESVRVGGKLETFP